MTVQKVKYSRANTHLRKDVVNKSIIRALNKFYNRRFKFRLIFDGHAKDFEQSICYKGVKNSITLSTDYQEHFSLINEEGSKSTFTLCDSFLLIIKIFPLPLINHFVHNSISLIFTQRKS